MRERYDSLNGLLVDGPENGPRIVLAHGAGAPMDSPFLQRITSGLVEKQIQVIRFEFPYMAARREGHRPGPGRPAVLLDHWRAVIEQVGDPASLIIGGKSMGGRIASLIADEIGVRGLVCLGYPFHPPGKPDRLRTEHLRTLRTPTLILQGTRDSLGNKSEVAEYDLSVSIQLTWLEDGDHSFKPRKKSGRTEEDNLDEAVKAIGRFIQVTGIPGQAS